MSVRFLLFYFLLFICVTDATANDSTSICSPDQRIRVLLHFNQDVRYDIIVDGQPVLKYCEIDLKLVNGKSLSERMNISKIDSSKTRSKIIAQIPVSRRFIPDEFNQSDILLTNGFRLIFRVYNDGVAYRIKTFFKDSITIQDEKAVFRFAGQSYAYAPLIQKRENQDIFHTSFEELYTYKNLDSLSDKDWMYSPVLNKTGNGIFVSITESDLADYPGMFLRGKGSATLQGAFAAYPLEEKIEEGDYPEKIVSRRTSWIAKTKGSRNFPWRVIIIARRDKDLPVNDLVYRLASPSKIDDVSWIHPGKCTDEWIIDINLFNVPFRSGINTDTYKYYIDFAKRFGFDRIMLDAGWSDTKDLFKINPQLNMDTLAAYSKLRGIKLSMWTLSWTLDRQLDSALQQFKRWGVDFIMTDFIDRDDQKAVNFCTRITEACAREKIMIMFHGVYPPKGFNRTYPNNITREGVLGSEYNAWSDKPTASYNCLIPFTRMLAGPLDYEPGILDNANIKTFKPIWGKVMSQTTRSQQLAMFLIYDNPMQIFSGNPSQGWMEPAFMELLGSFPTIWDTTIILQAEVGEHIITARSNRNNWYVGGMTGKNALDCEIDFSFIPEGLYKMTICRDGINADRNAMDYIIDSSAIQAGNRLKIHLAPAGGFAICLIKDPS